jgi:hypothetical protein
MKKITLTQHEWYDAMKLPTPHRNRKKYRRKEKHKKNGNQFGSHNYFSYIYRVKLRLWHFGNLEI